MRITFILSSLWLSGGVRVIAEYANRLTMRKHQVTLVVPGGTLDPDVLSELIPEVSIRQSRVARKSTANLLDLLRLTWSLAEAVPASDAIICTHTPTTAVGLLAGRLLGRGHLIWLFTDYREMFVGRPHENWLMRHALSWHDRALVLTDYSRQELNSYSRGDVIVVGLGLSDPDLFHPVPVEARRSTDGRRTILFVGDIRPRKGLADFLQAADLVYERCKDIKLQIVSKEECHVESCVPFDYVHRPSRAELARLYAACHLFVSASWGEGFGLPPLEAMACGTPVVLTDSGGVCEYARDGENCLVVPPRNPQALAEAMQRVLSDSALAQHLATNGPATAARFTWERAVDRFEAALADLT